jgi:hypothetical protein
MKIEIKILRMDNDGEKNYSNKDVRVKIGNLQLITSTQVETHHSIIIWLNWGLQHWEIKEEP